MSELLLKPAPAVQTTRVWLTDTDTPVAESEAPTGPLPSHGWAVTSGALWNLAHSNKLGSASKPTRLLKVANHGKSTAGSVDVLSRIRLNKDRSKRVGRAASLAGVLGVSLQPEKPAQIILPIVADLATTPTSLTTLLPAHGRGAVC